MEGKFRPSEQNLTEILNSEFPYVVPTYQREYSWTKDRVETFLEDLSANNDKVEKETHPDDYEYYFGSMVILKEDNQTDSFKRELIDGQQRMATVTMYLCVARDMLKVIENTPAVDQSTKDDAIFARSTIEQHIEIKNDSGEREKWKLKLNKRNESFFRDFIQEPGLPEEKIKIMKKQKNKSSSVKKLEVAYSLIYSSNLKKIEGLDLCQQVNYLRKSCNRLLRHFGLITITVKNEYDAFDIFETLNERGQRLIIADLVKNMLIKKVTKDEQDNVDQSWGEIMQNLGNEDSMMDRFLTFSLYSRNFFNYGILTKNTLFKTIKTKKASDQKSVVKYIKELKEDSEIFQAINNPTVTYWKDKGVVEHLESLKTLGAERTLPPIMAAYRNFGENKEELKEFLRLIVSYFFRYKIFQDGSADKVLKSMVNLAQNISDDSGSKTGKKWTNPDVAKFLKEQEGLDRDEKFKADFKIWQEENNTYCKYVLYQIQYKLDSVGTGELEQPVSKSLTLEHILPEKFDTYWNEFPNAINFVNRIGNMTILTHKMNSEIQNQTFSKKKTEAYSKSQLKINIETVNNKDEWTEEIINKRQEEFAEHAIEIWKI